jgi:hypothetical protein
MVTCSRCNQTGHNRRNARCPVLIQEAMQNRRQNGIRLLINMLSREPHHIRRRSIVQLLPPSLIILLPPSLITLITTTTSTTSTYIKDIKVIKKCTNDLNDLNECNICFDIDNLVYTNCSHGFCETCVKGYLESIKDKTIKPNCPCCRTELNSFHTNDTCKLVNIIQNISSSVVPATHQHVRTTRVQ